MNIEGNVRKIIVDPSGIPESKVLGHGKFIETLGMDSLTERLERALAKIILQQTFFSNRLPIGYQNFATRRRKILFPVLKKGVKSHRSTHPGEVQGRTLLW